LLNLGRPSTTVSIPTEPTTADPVPLPDYVRPDRSAEIAAMDAQLAQIAQDEQVNLGNTDRAYELARQLTALSLQQDEERYRREIATSPIGLAFSGVGGPQINRILRDLKVDRGFTRQASQITGASDALQNDLQKQQVVARANENRQIIADAIAQADAEAAQSIVNGIF